MLSETTDVRLWKESGEELFIRGNTVVVNCICDKFKSTGQTLNFRGKQWLNMLPLYNMKWNMWGVRGDSLKWNRGRMRLNIVLLHCTLIFLTTFTQGSLPSALTIETKTSRYERLSKFPTDFFILTQSWRIGRHRYLDKQNKCNNYHKWNWITLNRWMA